MFASIGASHKMPQTILKVKIYLPFCFWMWDLIMSLWRKPERDEVVTLWSPWSDTAESMIVQLTFCCAKPVTPLRTSSGYLTYNKAQQCDTVTRPQALVLENQLLKFSFPIHRYTLNISELYLVFKMGICFENQVGC